MTSFAPQGLAYQLRGIAVKNGGPPKWLHFGSKSRPKDAWILTQRKSRQNREMIHEKPSLFGPFWEPKSEIFRVIFWFRFLIDFSKLLEAFWHPF